MGRDSDSEQRTSSSTAGRKGRFVLGLLGLLFILACWSEDGSPPVLTDVIWPLTLPVQYLFNFTDFNFPDGKARLVGSVAFEDPDGDVVLLSVTWRDCGLEPAKGLEIVREDLKGKKTGKIPFYTIISTECPIGIYRLDLSATDGSGLTSNVLPVPYEIYESLE